jgi:hypothetical protein
MAAARFGLKVWYRRRGGPLGARPPWVYDDQDAGRWLSAAVEPTTGQSFCVFLPRRAGTCVAVVLREGRPAFPTQRLAVVLANRGAPTRGHVAWPDGITPSPWPAYSPELHPGERGLKALREPLANHIPPSLDALAAALTAALRLYWEHPQALLQLSAYPWWRAAVRSITTLSE